MRFTITFEVPDGTTFRVEPVSASAEEYVPPFADELIPLPPEAIPVHGDPVPFRGAATGAPVQGFCPVHRVPWKVVPAGVSKKTGKPYAAFTACPERGCDQRPAA